MKLIHFSAEHLRLQAPLPFGLRDASGRLLLGAGASIAHPDQLEHLRSLPLFADEDEANEWRRHLGAAVGSMLRQNATLKTIAELRPPDTHDTATHEASLPEQWDSLVSLLDLALREDGPAAGLLTRVGQVHERAVRLAQRQLDASLYHLIHTAAQSHQRYSSHHALLVMLVCDQAAQLLGWTPAQVTSLGCAALSMNVAMATLQDHLAASDTPLTPAMLHGLVASSGPMNISNSRSASAPYSATTSSGLTTLPRALDIFSPFSPRIIPWLTSFWNGSGQFT